MKGVLHPNWPLGDNVSYATISTSFLFILFYIFQIISDLKIPITIKLYAFFLFWRFVLSLVVHGVFVQGVYITGGKCLGGKGLGVHVLSVGGGGREGYVLELISLYCVSWHDIGYKSWCREYSWKSAWSRFLRSLSLRQILHDCHHLPPPPKCQSVLYMFTFTCI